MDFGLLVICLALFVVAMLYASVGHGGASGYLAVLSLSTYGAMEAAWLKQHAWCLNLVVAAIAFWHFHRAGYHSPKLTIPFVVASVPLAMFAGYLTVEGSVYDLLLSICLILAAWRLYTVNTDDVAVNSTIGWNVAVPTGGAIGFVSGLVGIGGGVLLSPILMLKRWATPKGVAATSAIFVWLNSLASLGGAALSNQMVLDFETLLPFIIAVLIGGFIGSRFGADIASQHIIRKLLIVVLIIASMKRIIGVF